MGRFPYIYDVCIFMYAFGLVFGRCRVSCFSPIVYISSMVCVRKLTKYSLSFCRYDCCLSFCYIFYVNVFKQYKYR